MMPTRIATMTPERWQRLQALFDEALALAPAARAEFIATACGDDVALREQLISLVLASVEVDEGFEDRVDRAIASTLRDAQLPPGAAVGRYRIVRLIGRGGMGAVYLAERADREFEQQVALKMVVDGALSNRFVARLRIERQILANLNHPNIARLLDGGTTADGTPYLAMEYVDGIRIDHYCKDRELGVDQRLRLFQQVCAAVQYAHQNLVVHRDIKPTNILVTEQGVPKLLDFGIAKLVDSNATHPDAALTRVHERVMSPENASPEQVRGERVGTVSDIYALGVLLYQLLSGFKPFDFDGWSFERMEKAICNEDPLKPSVAAANHARSAGDGKFVALSKQLSGDLDTIVMKAMHKDATRRYGSAGALLEDVSNYLQHRPIAARPDSFGYRAGKFWQRNRWMVTSGTMIVLLMTGLTVFYTWRLMIERDNAQRERTTATRVSDFMTEVFRVANPNESRGNTVSAREVLDAAVARIDKDLSNEPRVRSALSLKMAQAYIGIGLWKPAETLLDRSISEDRARGARTVELADALFTLATVQDRLNEYKPAQKALQEAWDMRKQLGLEDDRAGILTRVTLAQNFSTGYESKKAFATLESAEKAALAHFPQDRALIGQVFAAHGRVLLDSGDYKGSEPYLRQALTMLRDTVEGGSDLYVDTVIDHVQSLNKESRVLEARQELQALTGELTQHLGADHPLLSVVWMSLGISYCESGEYAECSIDFRRALDIRKKQAGPETMGLAMAYHNLGTASHDAGDLEGALQSLTTAQQIVHRVRNDRDVNLLPMLYEEVGARRDAGDLDGAERQLQEARRVADTLNSHAEWQPWLSLETGRLLLARRQYAKAATELRGMIAITPSQEQRLLTHAHVALGQSLLGLHDCDGAIAELRNAVEARHKLMPPRNWFIFDAENKLGDALSVCGHYAEAAPLLQSSVEALRELRPKGDLRLKDAEENLAEHMKRAAGLLDRSAAGQQPIAP